MINSETSANMGTKRRAKTKKKKKKKIQQKGIKKTTQKNKNMSNTNPNFIKDIIRRTLSDFKKNLYLVKL